MSNVLAIGAAVPHNPHPTGEGGLMGEAQQQGTNKKEEFVQFTEEQLEELRRIRRLQLMISMIIQVIYEDPKLTIEEASEMAAKAKEAALNMFPGKELAYDLLYRPRLQRAMAERFRIQ
ncbi:MAG TPA: hypothetical protein VGC88_02315 [Terriglobales bacterium]